MSSEAPVERTRGVRGLARRNRQRSGLLQQSPIRTLGVMERTRLRATFDEVAELYDRARPGYPRALLDDLVALARLTPGSRVVEIGHRPGDRAARGARPP